MGPSKEASLEMEPMLESRLSAGRLRRPEVHLDSPRPEERVVGFAWPAAASELPTWESLISSFSKRRVPPTRPVKRPLSPSGLLWPSSSSSATSTDKRRKVFWREMRRERDTSRVMPREGRQASLAGGVFSVDAVWIDDGGGFIILITL